MKTLTSLPRVVVAYPGGNPTAIVFGEVPKTQRKVLNAAILKAWKAQFPDQPEVEQCCFVTAPSNSEALGRVEMFGGEFCGNATRCVAWLLASGKDSEGLIEVSGVGRMLRTRVLGKQVAVEMPLALGKNFVKRVPEGILVQLEGIVHLVVVGQENPRRLLKALLRQNKYGLVAQPTVGISCYNSATQQAQFCVWINKVDTIFDETACGSGTCAIGVMAALAADAPVELNVRQPSGMAIKVKTMYGQGGVTGAEISGPITILYDGKLTL